jgi:beta-glucosidase
VNELGSAFVTGAQSVDTAMLTSAKHFIAAGATKYGTGYFIKPEMTAELKDKKREKYQKEHPHWNLKHYDPKVKFEELPRQPLDRGDAHLNQKELYTKHMIPYWGAVSAGTGSIMTSYSSVNGVPSHANAELLQYLKGDKGMNYQGFVITDYAGIDMIDRNYSIALPKAINAGIDMVMLPGTTSGCNPWLDGVCPTAMSFIKDMIKHVGEGRIAEDRVNDACKRVLMAKKRHGLFKQPLAPKELLNKVGSQEHRQLAREAAQQGTVVLSNKHKTLPLNLNEEKVCLAGEAGDNLGMQLGGWSLRWQGFSGNDQTKGTTLWQAMQKRMPHAVYDKTGKCAGADTVIAVIGEEAYAEGYGDSKELNLRADDAKMLKNVYEGKRSSLLETEAEEDSSRRRVILITMAGRPLWMEQEIAKADAFVAAFVPGIEGGQGVLDALTADYQPSGKLSITWPRDGKAPVTEESPGGSVLFEMGYGLSYDKNGWGREL